MVTGRWRLEVGGWGFAIPFVETLVLKNYYHYVCMHLGFKA